MTEKEAQRQLDTFLDRYTPEIVKAAKAAHKKMRARLPGAVETVYDNYNALVIGFGPTDKASESLLSLAMYPRYITLFFLKGAQLPDPTGRLEGSGKTVRGVRLNSAGDLDDPAIQQLIAAALAVSCTPMNNPANHQLVIKSISPKQRPRRPA